MILDEAEKTNVAKWLKLWQRHESKKLQRLAATVFMKVCVTELNEFIASHAPFPSLNYSLVFGNYSFALRESMYREYAQCSQFSCTYYFQFSSLLVIPFK